MKIRREEIRASAEAECPEAVEAASKLPEVVDVPDDPEVRQLVERMKNISSLTKLQILSLLRQGEMPVCMISRLLGKGQSLISHHLSDLRALGLVRERQSGRYKFYSVVEEELERICRQVNRLLGTPGS